MALASLIEAVSHNAATQIALSVCSSGNTAGLVLLIHIAAFRLFSVLIHLIESYLRFYLFVGESDEAVEYESGQGVQHVSPGY